MTPEEKAALMEELLAEMERRKDEEKRSRAVASRALNEMEQREGDFTPVTGYHMRQAVSTLLRAVFRVPYTVKIPAEKEETMRAFINDVCELVQLYRLRDEEGA